MSQNKPFKISQLPKIVDISNDDLLIISDISGKSISSKKMSLQQLVDYIYSQINSKIKKIADDSANSVAREVAVAEVNEAMDRYDISPKVIEILDTLGDGEVDNVINVNGGNAS